MHSDRAAGGRALQIGMLEKSQTGPAIVVRTTCRFSHAQREDWQGRRGGALFAANLRAALSGHACKDRLAIQEMPCLFACSTPCAVYLRCEGKIGYVLGRFSPTHADATALLDYAAHYIASPEGVVPFAYWPEGVKGHFIVRTPPEGFVSRG